MEGLLSTGPTSSSFNLLLVNTDVNDAQETLSNASIVKEEPKNI